VLDATLLGQTMQDWFPDFNRNAVKPHEKWLCPAHYDPESGHFAMPARSWLLRVGQYNVLIDTCLGNDKERPGFAEGHRLSTGYLERLTVVGLTPNNIDYVLCTHLHVDHVGWNTRVENRRWMPAFPNARYVYSTIDYETAKRDALNLTSRPFSKQMFEDSIHPVVEAGKARLVDGVHELLDKLTLRSAPAHSPGHFRIGLRSQDAVGIFTGDLLHSPIQVPLWEWSTRVCWDKRMAAVSRRSCLSFCASENELMLPGHFKAPHVGRIKRAGGTFAIDFGWWFSPQRRPSSPQGRRV
jgi:glyoxylase-like metal-dependent hydrolase (beta-lactamase superfamily II)